VVLVPGVNSAPAAAADALKMVIDALNRTSLHLPQQPFDFSRQYVHQAELYGLEADLLLLLLLGKEQVMTPALLPDSAAAAAAALWSSVGAAEV